MRFWGKLKIEDRIIKDITAESDDFKTAVSSVCAGFDLSKPLILEKHLSEMRQFNRTVFHADDFVESVPFDTFEIEKIVIKKKL